MRFLLILLLATGLQRLQAQPVYESLLLLSNPVAESPCVVVTNNLVFTSLIATGNTANANMITPGFTPSADAMLVAFVALSDPGTHIITNTGTPQLTWWKAAETNYNILGTPAHRMSAWVTQLSPGMSPGAIQVQLTNATPTGANIAVVQITGADTNKLWGSNAVVQIVHNGSNATANGQITFSAPNAGGSNGMVVAFADDANNAADMAAGSGFTELSETAYNTPAAGLFVQSRVFVPSSLTTVTNISTSRDWAAIGIEVKAGTNVCPGGFQSLTNQNLYRWYDAPYLALIDGDFIDSTLQWTNRAYAGDNLTGVTTTRPTFRTGILNSQPMILFDGTDDILDMTAIGLQTDITVTVVLQSTFTPATATVGVMDYSADTDELFLDRSAVPRTSLKVTDNSGNAGQSDDFPAGVEVTNAMMVTWVGNSSGWTYYMNGTNYGSDSIASTSLNLDRVGSVSGNPFKGYIGEILFNTNLAATALQVSNLWAGHISNKWFAAPGGDAALVANVAAATDSDGGTTGSIDTTGANFIVIGIAHYLEPVDISVSDSKSNTYTPLTTRYSNGQSSSVLYYVFNPTVGSGHTFTVTATAFYGSICVAAFSGIASSPFDVENGNITNSPWDTLTTGSVTPSVANSLAVTMVGWNGNGGTMSIGGSFTITDQVAYQAAVNMGGALAYRILTSASAQNPTWDGSSSPDDGAAAIAVFKD